MGCNIESIKEKVTIKNISSFFTIRNIGRICFATLLAIQAGFLSKYLVDYHPLDGISFLGFDVLFVAFHWFYIIIKIKDQLKCLRIVWLAYSVVIAIFNSFILGAKASRENILKSESAFFGPNVLKITLCITPVVCFLLITTADDSHKHQDVLMRLYGNIILELFDTIEALTIIIEPEDPKDPSSHLNRALIITIIVLTTISLLISPLELAEVKFEGGKWKIRKKVSFFRLVFKMIFGNLALMIVRLVAWLKFNHEASVFIAKNIVIVVVSVIEIFNLRNKPKRNEDTSA